MASALAGASPAGAATLLFSTGNVNGQMGSASRPGPTSGPNPETETADDFVLSSDSRITSLSFTGLLPSGVAISSIADVTAEIYRLFPSDSNTGRVPQVPTRVNSPSDVALTDRDSAVAGQLSFAASVLTTSFTALNSVDNGVNAFPNQTTGGEGPKSGQEVRFDVTLSTPIDLAAGHYFFVPEVLLSNPSQHFLWLSAERPITSGTSFAPDLQAWVRNAGLDPDWLRLGTDVVGGGSSFNMAFDVSGDVLSTTSAVPEPETFALLFLGTFGLGGLLRLRRSALSAAAEGSR